MSAAAVQTPVQEPKTLSFSDAHPLAMVGIFTVISLGLALAFVASLAIWLYGIRDSGVMSR
jgi:hypothetical protein